MPRKLDGLVCDSCRTSVSYWDDNVIGWQVIGTKVMCPNCQKSKKR